MVSKAKASTKRSSHFTLHSRERSKSNDESGKQSFAKSISNPRSVKTIIKLPQKLQHYYISFSFNSDSGSGFFFGETKTKKEEELIRGGAVFTQLGSRLPHGKNSLGERLLRNHQDQSLQGLIFISFIRLRGLCNHILFFLALLKYWEKWEMGSLYLCSFMCSILFIF